MGNQPSNPPPTEGNDENKTEGEKRREEEAKETKSAMVVVVGRVPFPELITEEIMPDIINNGANHRPQTSGTGYGDNTFSAYGGSFGNGGGGPNGGGPPFGGNDDLPRSEEVDASFKLSKIGGLNEQIRYLQRAVILPWMNPQVFREWGVLPPKGILLHGPPGTGKTYLAKALVNEIKNVTGERVNFFYRKGGDVFSMWFGESQKNLRAVFDAAKAKTPSVIFFDEFDGLCPSREGSNHGTQAYAGVVTCFLGQMDAIENGKVFVIAATNRVDAIDPAVRRPGRFDKLLSFGFPDEDARVAILTIHTDKWEADARPHRDLIKRLAQRTIGYSGADLEKLTKDAVYVAIEDNGGQVTDDLVVSEAQWMKAVAGMQKTSSANFGSYLITPTRPTDLVTTLIQPIVNELAEKIRPILLSPVESPTMHKSFIIFHARESQSKSFLNSNILQAVLSHQMFSKMVIFDLSMETISHKVLSGEQPSALAVIMEVINQAVSSSCPAVVVAPNYNELMDAGKANKYHRFIMNQLWKLRGPNVFLLATSSVPLDKQEDSSYWTPFAGIQRHSVVNNLGASQILTFFHNTLGTRIGADALKRAADEADRDNFEDVLNLHHELSQARTPKDIEETLKLYALTKLQ